MLFKLTIGRALRFGPMNHRNFYRPYWSTVDRVTGQNSLRHTFMDCRTFYDT